MSTQQSTSQNNSTNNMGEIRDLKPVARKLNEKSDGLQATLKKINEKLNELSLGLETWLSDRMREEVFCLEARSTGEELGLVDDKRIYRHGWDLGYCKIDDKWCLAVRELWVNFEDQIDTYSGQKYKEEQVGIEGSPKPLLSAPRHVRIAAAGKIAQLIDVIKTAAEEATQEIEQAEKLAEEL